MKPDNETLYFNRELSWLEFNGRVLEIALNKKTPELERAKFFGIFSNNLDEFFMVRVATLLRRIELKDKRPDRSGLKPEEQLDLLLNKVKELLAKRDNNWSRSLIPSLKSKNIEALNFAQLNEEQRKFVDDFFYEQVFPVINPMACDLGHPFPVLQSKQLYFAVQSCLLEDNKKKPLFSIVPVPEKVFSRLIQLPVGDRSSQFIFIEEIIKNHLDKIYIGNEIQNLGLFRISRDAEFSLAEADAEDLLQLVESRLKVRRKSPVVRLEIEDGLHKSLLKRLQEELDVEDALVFRCPNRIDPRFFFELYKNVQNNGLKLEPLSGIEPKWAQGNLFKSIREKDRFLHHPYHTFDPVVRLIEQAADDKKVLAIKQVLYRVSGNSPIIRALAKASEKGKQVSVLMELTARFDEESNIEYAQQLEQANCHVVHGVLGLKTHAKALLIIRKEATGIRRYVHLATGNYNDITAKQYSDCGILSAREDMAEDVSHLFNVITGYSRPMQWRHLSAAPINLKENIIDLIENEIRMSRKEMPGHIFAKLNSLLDKEVIDALYRASQSHVKIDLVVRGICALKPGIKGISDNITVRSIIGRYLEHPRILRLKNGSNHLHFISSADWMPRNLYKRIEVMVPVLDEGVKALIDELIEFNLSDNTNTWILDAKGKYSKLKHSGVEEFDMFREFHRRYHDRNKKDPTQLK